MAQPLVTACLTVYNAADFLYATLESLANQSWGNLQILISDDASDDGTAGIIADFCEKYPQFITYRQETSLGWVNNSNFLLNKVSSDYFFQCYHDDILEPDYVTKLVNCLLEDTDIVGAYCDVAVTNNSGDTIIRSYTEICGVEDPVERGLSIINMQGLPWLTNRGVFRTEVLQRVGGLRKNLAGEFSAAFPWVLALALEGRFKRVKSVLCHKKLLPGGVSSQWKKTYKEYFALYVDLYQSVWNSRLAQKQKDILLLEIGHHCNSIMSQKKLC